MMSNRRNHPNVTDGAVRINTEIFSIILWISFARFEGRHLVRSLALRVHLSPEVSCAWHSDRDMIVNNNSNAKSKPNQARKS